MKYDDYSDEELLRLYREDRDGRIPDYLLEKYKGLVRKKARAVFLAGGDVDDLIQEGMIGLFKAIRDYQEDRQASTTLTSFISMTILRSPMWMSDITVSSTTRRFITS